MFRRTATTAATVTIAAVAALNPAAAFGQTSAPAPPPPPPPPIAIPAPPPPPPAQPAPPPGPQILKPAAASTAKMATKIAEAMTGSAFGWQFAIAQNGMFATSGSGGTARSRADNGGTRVAMKPTMRYELASVTKNVTALSTMKLLRLRGLTVKSSIDSYLPPDWKRGPGFKEKKVTFEHLLTHTSGIFQATQTAACKDVCANSWDGVRGHVDVGVVPGSDRVYKNANYALLRVLNARMWKAAGAKIYGFKTEYVETTNWKGDEIKKPVQVKVVLEADETNHARYAMDHFQRHIFAPAGIKNVGCVAPDATTAGLNYGADARPKSKGSLLSWPSSQCAGNAGLRLSSIELVRYLAHLRHGTIAHPADLAVMDALRAGWREADNLGPGTPAGVRWHGGGLLGSAELHTCAITFPDGTEASMIVNSPMPGLNKCRVLRDAWIAALS